MNKEEQAKYYLNTKTPAPAKDALDYQFERAIERAMTTPIIDVRQQSSYAGFVDWYEAPPYRLGVGLAIEFVDSATYGMKLGSFYPFWCLQCGFVSKKTPPTNLNWKLLPKKKVDNAVEMMNRVIEKFENSANPKTVVMRRDKTNFQWNLPLTENEISKLAKVYQDLTRRAK